MFKFLKSLFASEKVLEIEKVDLEKLESWFEEKVSNIGFNEQAKSYLKKIEEIKTQIPSLVENLKNAEVSKDNKNVEERIKNIVKGHKDNYAREIERFWEDLEILSKEHFKNLQEYKEVITFNKNVDKKIGELAKRTAKGYQAAQHLFFDPVEKLFKKMGELNTLIKEFEKKIKNFGIEEELSLIYELIHQLNQDISKKESFTLQIKEKEKEKNDSNKNLEEKEKELQTLKESKEYSQYKEIENQIGEVDKKVKYNENNIFSYFSKLNKPLRKYERVALDNQIIQAYINDGIKSFWQDPELKIKEALQGLKKALTENTIQFEDKQKNNFLELIGKSETNYLDELMALGNKLKEERKELIKQTEAYEIVVKIDESNKKINSEKERINSLEQELSTLKSKLEKINLEKIEKEINEKASKIFGIKLTISSS
jgi:hypothetical protein